MPEGVIMKIKILKETEKAVSILNEEKMSLEDMISDGDVNVNVLRDYNEMSDYIWLPKSQITIENGYVVNMADWLARKNGFETESMKQQKQDAFKNGCDRYTKALEFAKQNGLKVRVKMKLATILSLISEAGLEFNF